MITKSLREWKKRNRVKVQEQNSRYYQKNREKIYLKKVAWDKANPEKVKNHHKRDYERHKDGRQAHQRSYNKSLEGRYASYKMSATTRSLSFDLTLEEFRTLWQLSCTYCHSRIETVGLDRINNTKGYSIANVIPCCSICNYARGDEFTHEEMVTVIGPAISKVRFLRS